MEIKDKDKHTFVKGYDTLSFMTSSITAHLYGSFLNKDSWFELKSKRHKCNSPKVPKELKDKLGFHWDIDSIMDKSRLTRDEVIDHANDLVEMGLLFRISGGMGVPTWYTIMEDAYDDFEKVFSPIMKHLQSKRRSARNDGFKPKMKKYDFIHMVQHFEIPSELLKATKGWKLELSARIPLFIQCGKCRPLSVENVDSTRENPKENLIGSKYYSSVEIFHSACLKAYSDVSIEKEGEDTENTTKGVDLSESTKDSEGGSVPLETDQPLEANGQSKDATPIKEKTSEEKIEDAQRDMADKAARELASKPKEPYKPKPKPKIKRVAVTSVNQVIGIIHECRTSMYEEYDLARWLQVHYDLIPQFAKIDDCVSWTRKVLSKEHDYSEVIFNNGNKLTEEIQGEDRIRKLFEGVPEPTLEER